MLSELSDLMKNIVEGALTVRRTVTYSALVVGCILIVLAHQHVSKMVVPMIGHVVYVSYIIMLLCYVSYELAIFQLYIFGYFNGNFQSIT